MMNNTNDSIIGSISHGTMRPQDLLPAFLDALAIVAPDEYAQLMVMPFGVIPAHAMDDGRADWWESDDAQWALESLFDALDSNAPEGYYFGAHPGDGSDYGFWAIEE